MRQGSSWGILFRLPGPQSWYETRTNVPTPRRSWPVFTKRKAAARWPKSGKTWENMNYTIKGQPMTLPALVTFLGIDFPDSFPSGIVSSIIFGLIGIVLLLFGFKLFDWMTPRLHIQTELGEKHNLAVAIVIGAYFLAIAFIIAHVVGG